MDLESINVLFGFGIFLWALMTARQRLPLKISAEPKLKPIMPWSLYYCAAVKESVFLCCTFPSHCAAPLWVFGLTAFWARGLSPPTSCLLPTVWEGDLMAHVPRNQTFEPDKGLGQEEKTRAASLPRCSLLLSPQLCCELSSLSPPFCLSLTIIYPLLLTLFLLNTYRSSSVHKAFRGGPLWHGSMAHSSHLFC